MPLSEDARNIHNQLRVQMGQEFARRQLWTKKERVAALITYMRAFSGQAYPLHRVDEFFGWPKGTTVGMVRQFIDANIVKRKTRKGLPVGSGHVYSYTLVGEASQISSQDETDTAPKKVKQVQAKSDPNEYKSWVEERAWRYLRDTDHKSAGMALNVIKDFVSYINK